MPNGFTVTDLIHTPNFLECGRVLWKGFDHEKNGEGSFEEAGGSAEQAHALMAGPGSDPALKVCIVTPDGSFAALCGMWYDPVAGFAVVEPVATVPEFRGLGLGRAAVLEGVRRVYERGATRVIVGSSQQFYHTIGFKAWQAASLWVQPRLSQPSETAENTLV